MFVVPVGALVLPAEALAKAGIAIDPIAFRPLAARHPGCRAFSIRQLTIAQDRASGMAREAHMAAES
ncbi:MAG: hypothetical protein ABFD69_06730 [Candidatus Sumerlaeia bacterium]